MTVFKKNISLSTKNPGLNPVPDWLRIQQQSGSGFCNILDPDPTSEPAKYLDLDPKSDFYTLKDLLMCLEIQGCALHRNSGTGTAR
jgi:hypothetical protein